MPKAWKVSWPTTRAFTRVLRSYHPDILHLHYTGFLGPYPWLGHAHSARKIFITDHTSHPEGYIPMRAPGWKRFLARAINYPVTNVVCVSDYGYRCNTARDLLHRNRFFSIYNGIELNQSWNSAQYAQRFRRKYEIPAHKSIVAQLSWMIPEKGILDLLEAARLVVRRDPRAHFVLAGDGAYRDRFIERSIALGLRDHITWTGNLLDPRGDGVYAAADVICQMSRWEEVFGFVIAEAMAASKPVVATRVGGIPELVEDGRTGYLVGRGDHEGMAEKILALLGDSSLRHQMGTAGRLAAEARFDLAANVARLLELYGIAAPQATASAGTVRLGAGVSLAKSSTGTPVA